MSNSDSEADVQTGIKRLEEENQRLRHDILALRQFIDSMQNVMEAIETSLPDAEIMELLSQVLDNAMQAINVKDGSLLVVDEDTGELVFVLTHGDVPQEQLAWRRVPPGEGIAGWVAKHRKATIANDAQSDDRFYSAVDDDLKFRTQSVLAAPIIGGGDVLGVIEMLNKKDDQLFSVGDQTLLTLMCRFSGELLYSVMKQNQEQGKLV